MLQILILQGKPYYILKIEDENLLINALRQDDERALKKLYHLYWIKLLAIANNRLVNGFEAEECVQDVFVGLWRTRHTLHITSHLGAYLSAAVKNQVLNRLAKRYTNKHNIKFETTEFAYETADANLLTRDLNLTIEAAVNQLPDKCQMVYRMSRIQGKNNATIATELNLSEKTVEGHLTKAIKNIRQRLTGETVVALTILEWYAHHKK